LGCKFVQTTDGSAGNLDSCVLSVYKWGGSSHAILCSGTDEDKKDCPFWSGPRTVVRKSRKAKDRIDHVVESVQSAPE
jgi:hypothetical protein